MTPLKISTSADTVPLLSRRAGTVGVSAQSRSLTVTIPSSYGTPFAPSQLPFDTDLENGIASSSARSPEFNPKKERIFDVQYSGDQGWNDYLHWQMVHPGKYPTKELDNCSCYGESPAGEGVANMAYSSTSERDQPDFPAIFSPLPPQRVSRTFSNQHSGCPMSSFEMYISIALWTWCFACLSLFFLALFFIDNEHDFDLEIMDISGW